MAKIREEVGENCEIHGKITASTVNSEHGSEAHIVKHLALLFNIIYISDSKINNDTNSSRKVAT